MDFGRFLEQWTVSTFFPPLWNALAAEKEQRNTAEMEFVKEVLVDVNDRWKYLYGETIDKIDVELFRFLLNVKSRCITKGKELDLGWTGKEPELAAMGIDQTTFRTNADYLMSTGLMTRIHQTRHNAQTHSLLVQDEYYVTEFGTGFIGFVRERDDVAESEYEEV